MFRYQDVFAKKTTADRGATGSTHLVCPAPEGTKYAAAVKWKLPAVTKDWLLKCAEMRCRVSEEPYLLTKNSRLSAFASPATSVLSASITCEVVQIIIFINAVRNILQPKCNFN